MPEHILFLTGHLAHPRLQKVLAGFGNPGFEWSVFDVGVKVAALMTEAIIMRRLPRPVAADRVLLFSALNRSGSDELAEVVENWLRAEPPAPALPPSAA